MMKLRPIDPSRARTRKLGTLSRLVAHDQFATTVPAGASVREFLATLPDTLAARDLRDLAGAIASGQLLAVMLSNSGGAWDNAKKKIEDGLFGGKGTDNHTAAIVCDTVGDPFKDTAGPALNPLIKVMNLTGILIAGIVIQNITLTARILIVSISGICLIGAVLFSKRGSIVDDKALIASPATTPKIPSEEVT